MIWRISGAPRAQLATTRKLGVLVALVISWQSAAHGHALSLPETGIRAFDIGGAPHTAVAACGYDAAGNRRYPRVPRGSWMFNVHGNRDARVKAVAGAPATEGACLFGEQPVGGLTHGRHGDDLPFNSTTCASDGVPAFVYDATRNMKAAEAGAGAFEANAPSLYNLGRQLAFDEASGAFTATGELSQAALQGAREIPLNLGNPAIPEGFAKFTTQTFQSPAGSFQMHFYMNPTTQEVFYGLDYKAVFNNGIMLYTPGGL